MNYRNVREGSTLYVKVEDLYPTQPDLGMREVDFKVKAIKKMSEKKFESYLVEKVSPVIIGPKGKMYIVDHHHHAFSLLKTKKTWIYVQVWHNWSNLSVEKFWKKMRDSRFVLLKKGNLSISYHQLPHKISQMGNDEYRSLAWSVREKKGFDKADHIPFFEFQWANFYRKYFSLDLLKDHYEVALKLAIHLSKTKFAKHLPGFKG